MNASSAGRPCESIAYPYGDHDDRVVEAARRAGYVAAGTLPSRLDERGPLRFPRVGVYYGDDERRFRLKVSRPLRALSRLAIVGRPRSEHGRRRFTE